MKRIYNEEFAYPRKLQMGFLYLSVTKRSECEKEFKTKTEKEAFEKLKMYRKEEHLKKDKGDISYIT